MRRTGLVLSTLILCLTGTPSGAQQPGAPDPFEHVRPLIGKTFRATREDRDPNAAPPKAGDNIMRWDWAVRGKAVRVVHAFEDGSYGGESLIHYDRERKALVYRYVTSAGFYTEGVMTTDSGRITSEERVVGLDTVAVVKSVYLLNANGTMRASAEYIGKDGSTRPGHWFVYKEDPGAKVNLQAGPG